jgi:hypothetical protein
MNTQTITKNNLKAIHDVACAGWKTKLEDYAKRKPFDSEIELTQSEVDEMFNASDAKQKKVLDKFFTKPKSIIDGVNSFEDACKVLGLNAFDVFNTKFDSVSDIAFKKLKVIIKALNEGWYPNWENENEGKYWCWWTMKGGFSYYTTSYYSTFTFVPSALCLRTRELTEHAAKIALQEYKEYYS